MDLIEKIISAGFKRKLFGRDEADFKLANGWFGLTVYHPDEIFLKDDKEVIISLGGILIDFYEPIFLNEGEIDLVLNNFSKIKYICLRSAGKTIYKTVSGNIPSPEIVDSFLESK